MSQKNSFITMLEQIAVLNKNSVEIISKLSDVVGTKDSSVTVNYLDNDGSSSQYQLPSVGYLKKEIDLANSNIKKLASLDDESSVVINYGNTTKKIKSIDLNREPDQISGLEVVNTFNQKHNWFFEDLINPLLSIEINLDDKIDDSCSKVLSRRYILDFQKDINGTITPAGQISKSDFEDKFLYQNKSIEDFLEWFMNPTNVGVSRYDPNHYIDEQTFDLDYKTINFKGYFSVLKYEKDTINNKLYYHVNTLTYYDRNGETRILAVGDILSTTAKDSYTKWKIIEVNVSSSLFRLDLERLEGYDPVAIGTNMLEYYSPLTSSNKINVSIGFDEYNIVFLKPINTDSGIIGSSWSKSVCFYTNDLTLDTDSKVGMKDFYVNSVYDYGAVLKDLVTKQIPTQQGVVPNKPLMLSDNFKVVQINKHLTDTKDYKTLKKLHGNKNAIKTKINQVNDAILEKNKELNTKQFKSVAERSKSNNELKELITSQESETKLYSSLVSQITNSKAEATAIPKFRIRGFWDVPDTIYRDGKPQEILGFEIQWRYGSKFGTKNITEGFELKKDNLYSGNVESEPRYIKKTGYYSEWNTLKSDIRKRFYDESTGKWTWQIEDISDADTPNINQLDIAIQKNEKVDIRVRSISEVGYPDSPFVSDWSELMVIEFPDSMNDVLGDSELILKEATQEEVKVQFENELTTKGINRHVQDSYNLNEKYVAHTDKTISTSFKDNFGNSLLLFDYLKQMSDKIKSLEEAISRVKGEIKVTLFRGTQETEIKNGASIESVIECQDYMNIIPSATTNAITVENNVYMISDFYVKIENIALSNPLSLLTIDTLQTIADSNEGDLDDFKECSMVNENGTFIYQRDNQFLWMMPKATIGGETTDLYNNIITSSSAAILTDNKNFSDYQINHQDILDTDIWNLSASATIGATIHPQIDGNSVFMSPTLSGTNSLVDSNQQNVHMIDAQDSLIVPLNIYFKPECGVSNGLPFEIDISDQPEQLYKTVKMLVKPENMARQFEFTLRFNFHRHKRYTQTQTFTN